MKNRGPVHRPRPYPRHIHQQQARGSGGNGRIRIVLAIGIMLAIIRGVFNYYSSRELVEDEMVEVVTSTVDSSADGSTKTVIKRVAKPKDLDWKSVKKMITEEPPTLHAAVDTVQWRKRRYVRYLSIDTAVQRAGELYMQRYHPLYGSAVILQPRTGRVLGLISYTNPKVEKISDNLYLNADFPAASIFKTVTAAAAIEKNGMDGSTLLKMNGKNYTLYKAQLEKELEHFREVTMGQAYAWSYNSVFGRLGIHYVGKNALDGYAQKFGFNDVVPFELPVEISQYRAPEDDFAIGEMASGFNKKTTLSPLLGALIAGSVSNKGRMIRPTLVDSVIDLESGIVVYAREPRAWRIVMGESGAAELSRMMQGVTQYGTARKSFENIKQSSLFRPFEHGGKTGNVDRPGVGRTEWFIGFVKDSSSVDEDISCAVLTVHGPKWTVRSGYIGAELMRRTILSIKKEKERARLEAEAAEKARQQAIADSLAQEKKRAQAKKDSLTAQQNKSTADTVETEE